MTGKSLGFRTGSYGSLQQQQSNGVLQNHATSLLVRKNSKLLLSNYREKERLLPYLCRCLCRMRVGMAILFSFAVLAFLWGFFTVNKAPGGSGSDIDDGLQHGRYKIWGVTNHLASVFPGKEDSQKDDSSHIQNYSEVSAEKMTHIQIPASTKPVMVSPVFGGYNSLDHPCKSFALPPPPPPNRKRIGPRPCPVCYIPDEQAVASMPGSPSRSPLLHNLTYVHEETPIEFEPHGGSDFGGYPSLKQRNDSFDIKESMVVHCGFVKGSAPGQGSGFDIDEADLAELGQFHDVIVASAIFGNYDVIQQPSNVSEAARTHVPFYMFIDEETEKYMKNVSVLDGSKRVGLWKIIVVHNVPYKDARRNGKVPKLLLHRLFPNVRYSIWIDGKLKLVVDPYQVLERFLWRQNATFAISRHYRRFDVFEEAEANKAAGKYDNGTIDYQIDFYRKEGLTHYSEAKLPITSDVPEGCVILREHIPITNLFTCLWFNEVDRFTSRDQLSFSTVRDKIMSKVNWGINMFLDCERRNFVIQAYHRELLEHMRPPALPVTVRDQPPPRTPSMVVRDNTARRNPGRKTPAKRGRDRRSGSKHHRKVSVGNRDTNSF
ncbi:hypothetical protein Ancab_025430 [Ancistrocladus abbreviatus]